MRIPTDAKESNNYFITEKYKKSINRLFLFTFGRISVKTISVAKPLKYPYQKNLHVVHKLNPNTFCSRYCG